MHQVSIAVVADYSFWERYIGGTEIRTSIAIAKSRLSATVWHASFVFENQFNVLIKVESVLCSDSGGE